MLTMLGSVASQGGNAPVDIYYRGDEKSNLCGGWNVSYGYHASGYIYLKSSMDDSNMGQGGETNTRNNDKVLALGRNVVEIEFRINSFNENDYKDIRIRIDGESGAKEYRYTGYEGSDVEVGTHIVRLYVRNPLTDPPIKKVSISNQSIVNRVSVYRVTLIDGTIEA